MCGPIRPHNRKFEACSWEPHEASGSLFRTGACVTGLFQREPVRGRRLNGAVTDSIAEELANLESVGRVSARGRRPIHAEFGFSAMKRDDDSGEPAATASTGDFTAELDAARDRLRAQVAPE